jgi:hypothetical protein
MVEFIGNPFEIKSENINIRVSPSFKSLVLAAAQKRDVTTSDLVELAVTKELSGTCIEMDSPLREVATAYATQRKVPVTQILSEALNLMFPNADANAAMVESRKAQKVNLVHLMDLLPIRIPKPKMQNSAVEVITPQYPPDCFLTMNDENELVPVSTWTSLDNFPRPRNEAEWFEAKKALPHAQKWLFIEMNNSLKGVQLGFYNEITKLVNIAQMYNTHQYFSCDLADLKRWAYVEIPTI